MSDIAASRKGSCLCGAIQLTIRGKPVETHLCHCTSCQKLTGSVFAAFVTLKDEQLQIAVGAGHELKTHVDSAGSESGNTLERRFCGTCGSPILIRSKMLPNVTVVHLGLLEPYPMSEDGAAGTEGQQQTEDDGWKLTPSIEYWCVRKRSWVGDTGAEVVSQRQPQPGTEEFAKVMKMYGFA
ncbi:hypothetical protein PG990_008060 [Apiospora arundinis]